MFRELSDDDSGGYRQYGARSDSRSGVLAQVQEFCSEHRRAVLVAGVVLLLLLLVVIPVAVTSRNSGGGGGGDGPTPVVGSWTTIASLPVYKVGSSTRLLLYLPDVNGASEQALTLADNFAAAGFSVYLLDYFDGFKRNNSHTQQQSLDRSRAALSSLRQSFPAASILSTGYCWGGGVGVSLTFGSPRVDGSVVAHAAGVSTSMVSSIQAPVSFVMPQSDPSFNGAAASFLNLTLLLGIEAQFRVYPNVSHGFAANTPSTQQAAQQKERAFNDSVMWLHEHAW